MLWDFLARRRRKVEIAPIEDSARARTLPQDRELTEEERAIAGWLLTHAKPPALSYLPQLEFARVIGKCSCGCPTIDLRVAEDVPAGDPAENPLGDAFGKVNGNSVGVMLLQSGGFLGCLEVYDLSEIERPYGLPDLHSLELANWG